MTDSPEWLDAPLEDLTTAQWESLCDGCALCCLHKLEDADTGDIHYSGVACRLLDIDRCRCLDYPNRETRVPACITLVPERSSDFKMLPETCAYRLRSEGKPLLEWHPLISGDPASVHDAGISIRGRAVSERDVGEPDDSGPWLPPA